jgi:hypothetical protein
VECPVDGDARRQLGHQAVEPPVVRSGQHVGSRRTGRLPAQGLYLPPRKQGGIGLRSEPTVDRTTTSIGEAWKRTRSLLRKFPPVVLSIPNPDRVR